MLSASRVRTNDASGIATPPGPSRIRINNLDVQSIGVLAFADRMPQQPNVGVEVCRLVRFMRDVLIALPLEHRDLDIEDSNQPPVLTLDFIRAHRIAREIDHESTGTRTQEFAVLIERDREEMPISVIHGRPHSAAHRSIQATSAS